MRGEARSLGRENKVASVRDIQLYIGDPESPAQAPQTIAM